MNKSYVLEAEPGHYVIQGGDATLTVERISEVVEAEKKIPDDVKNAIKEFLENLKDQVIEALGKQVEVNIPEELSQYTDLIIEIIKLLFN